MQMAKRLNFNLEWNGVSLVYNYKWQEIFQWFSHLPLNEGGLPDFKLEHQLSILFISTDNLKQIFCQHCENIYEELDLGTVF